MVVGGGSRSRRSRSIGESPGYHKSRIYPIRSNRTFRQVAMSRCRDVALLVSITHLQIIQNMDVLL